MAVNAHGRKRTTADLDLLLTAEGLTEFRRRFVPKDYEEVSGRPRRFSDRKNGVTIDFLVTGFFPGSSVPARLPTRTHRWLARSSKTLAWWT